MNEEKLKALGAVLAQIEKQYGKGAIMKLGEEAGNTDIDVIPTGCLALDLALGIGGIPRGRMVEIYGPESSGKTTVARIFARAVNCEHPARYGRTGARHRRQPRALLGGGYHRRGLGGGAYPKGRDRGGYGRFPCGTASEAHVAGAP